MYGFDTEKEERAIAALVVYVVYRSRDNTRFKVSTKMWDQITGFVRLSAKKSTNIPEFIDYFRKPMRCESITAKYCEVDGKQAAKMLSSGELFVSGQTEQRQFLTSLLEQANQSKVLHALIKETAFIIMLVRERLEIEKHTDKVD